MSDSVQALAAEVAEMKALVVVLAQTQMLLQKKVQTAEALLRVVGQEG